MPRLGKIHLGVKKQNAKGVEHPSATDYFVCPDELQKIYGKEPRELPVLIPVEDAEYWASQYYRCYSRTRGLVCKGDGEKCNRMVDTKTGALANRDSTEVVWKVDMPCEGRECGDYQGKKCQETMCLQFLLPEAPGLGVWQIDTRSINSIRNINSATELIRGLFGRVRMIPLLLTLEPQEVINPDDGKKKHVRVLNLRQKETLKELLALSQKPIYELLAPPPAENEAALDVENDEETEPGPEPRVKPDIEQAEKDAKELWPEDVSEVKPEPEVEKQSGNPMTREELYDWVATAKGWKSAKTARQYLVNALKIEESRIDKDPGGVYKEIMPLFGKP